MADVGPQHELSGYVTSFISHRQCSKYIQDISKTDGRCQCGHTREFHEEVGLITTVPSNSEEKWNPDIHTERISPNTYGTIAFHGFGQEIIRHAPYVRLDYKVYESGMETVWHLLSEHWNMVPPKLILTVTGGAKRFFMKNRLKTSFKRGLINAATSTGAWIITGGTSTGVMKFVGEAVRDHMLTSGTSEQPVVALGIATWGIVDNKEALISEDGQGMFPAHYNVDDLSPKSVRGVAALDHNHSHFILVDNGTKSKFGAEIKFRAGLEHFISDKMETGVARNQSRMKDPNKIQRRSDLFCVHVPVVLLVLEGGENTLKTAAEAVANSTPVVIIQGSGRAADFIALAYRLTRNKDGDEDKNDFSSTFDQEMTGRAATMFDWSREKNPQEKERKIENCVTVVRRCLQHRQLLTVYHIDDVDTTKEIDQAILYALLKANQSDAKSQLNLALAWNRCDVARQEIFSIENRTNWQQMNLHEAMFTALLQDRADFAQLFLDNGVDLQHFLTVSRLRDLYADVVNNNNAGVAAGLTLHLLQQVQLPSDLVVLLGFSAPSQNANGLSAVSCCQRERWIEDIPNLLFIVGRLIANLLSDQQENLYKGSKFVVSEGDVDKRTTLNYRVVNETGNGDYPSGQSTTRQRRDPPGQRVSHSDGHYSQTVSSIDSPKGADCKGVHDRSARGKQARQADFAQPERDLFLWAVLLNRRDLAKLFWKASKDHIGGALTASALLKSLGKKADQEEESDLALDLWKHSEEWEERAVGVLNECYQRDKQLTHSVLTREVDRWGGLTLFLMADSAEQMDFMGQSSCQTKLNRIWKGKMALYTSMWKIICTMFVPLLLPLIRFSPQEFAFKSQQKSDHAAQRSFSNNEHRLSVISLRNQDGKGHDNGDDGTEFVPVPSRRPRKQVDEKLYQVNVCSSCSSKTMSNIIAAIFYYYTAPVTKFCFHTVSYLVFLSIFSYFVLTDLNPVVVKPPSILEYVIWGWAASLLIEEMRQIAVQHPMSVTYKMAGYFENVWNRIDLVIHVLFITSIILRWYLPPESFVWARVSYSITLGMYFLRFMQVFFVEKNIGPKVIMIRRMLKDLAFFIAILLVVLLAYGVASQALLYPNSEATWYLLKDIVYKPYWQMYGELFLDELEGNVDGCSAEPSIWKNATAGVKRCPEKSMMPILLFVVYMIMTNILLLNLLIAMFSHTFERVQENSEKVWRFYRYSLVHEYFDKPALVPPLILINHIYRVFKHCIKCCRDDPDTNTDFRQRLSHEQNKRLTAFERSGMENFLMKQSVVDREHIDAKVSTASDRIEKVIEDLEQIKEQVGSQSSTDKDEPSMPAPVVSSLESTHNGTKYTDNVEIRALQHHVQDLEEKLEQQSKAMNQVLNIVIQLKQCSEVGAGAATSPGGSSDPLAPVPALTPAASPSSSIRSTRTHYHRPDPEIEIQDVGTDNFHF